MRGNETTPGLPIRSLMSQDVRMRKTVNNAGRKMFQVLGTVSGYQGNTQWKSRGTASSSDRALFSFVSDWCLQCVYVVTMFLQIFDMNRPSTNRISWLNSIRIDISHHHYQLPGQDHGNKAHTVCLIKLRLWKDKSFQILDRFEINVSLVPVLLTIEQSLFHR